MFAVAVVGCSDAGTTDVESDTTRSILPDLAKAGQPPELDPAVVSSGAALYSQFCASCHKADLTGEPDWKTPNEDGSYRAPPHDGSGHTWHHSDQLLLTIIRDGLESVESNMPTYAGTLTDAQIMSIVEFLKSSWPPEERLFQWQMTWQESQG